MTQKLGKCISGTIFIIFILSTFAMSDVRISAEGEYTETHLVVHIYADTTDISVGDADPLISYGVKMIYDDADIISPVAVKNEVEWYFGTAENPLPTPNTVPDTSKDGEIVIIGGKLDENPINQGVSGSKVLLASVTFVRVQTDTAPVISLELGKDGTFTNFVTTAGAILDNGPRLAFLDPVIVPECNLPGDVNGDGRVNMSDVSVIQLSWGQEGEDLVGDLNGDGRINMSDISIIQLNWGSTCP